MYIKFISDEGPVTVETNSYKVYEHGLNDEFRTVVINYVVQDSENAPRRVDFKIGKGKSYYRSAFVMNNEGQTIDKIYITNDQGPAVEVPEPSQLCVG